MKQRAAYRRSEGRNRVRPLLGLGAAVEIRACTVVSPWDLGRRAGLVVARERAGGAKVKALDGVTGTLVSVAAVAVEQAAWRRARAHVDEAVARRGGLVHSDSLLEHDLTKPCLLQGGSHCVYVAPEVSCGGGEWALGRGTFEPLLLLGRSHAHGLGVGRGRGAVDELVKVHGQHTLHAVYSLGLKATVGERVDLVVTLGLVACSEGVGVAGLAPPCSGLALSVVVNHARARRVQQAANGEIVVVQVLKGVCGRVLVIRGPKESASEFVVVHCSIIATVPVVHEDTKAELGIVPYPLEEHLAIGACLGFVVGAVGHDGAHCGLVGLKVLLVLGLGQVDVWRVVLALAASRRLFWR